MRSKAEIIIDYFSCTFRLSSRLFGGPSVGEEFAIKFPGADSSIASALKRKLKAERCRREYRPSTPSVSGRGSRSGKDRCHNTSVAILKRLDARVIY